MIKNQPILNGKTRWQDNCMACRIESVVRELENLEHADSGTGI